MVNRICSSPLSFIIVNLLSLLTRILFNLRVFGNLPPAACTLAFCICICIYIQIKDFMNPVMSGQHRAFNKEITNLITRKKLTDAENYNFKQASKFILDNYQLRCNNCKYQEHPLKRAMMDITE